MILAVIGGAIAGVGTILVISSGYSALGFLAGHVIFQEYFPMRCNFSAVIIGH